jgi:hypothetical protein
MTIEVEMECEPESLPGRLVASRGLRYPRTFRYNPDTEDLAGRLAVSGVVAAWVDKIIQST